MASPLKSIGEMIFGGGQSQGASPMLMMPPAMPSTPPPLQQPLGNQGTNKPAQNPSVVSAAAPVAGQQNLAPKSLLGQ